MAIELTSDPAMHDESPVELNDDQREVIKKNLGELSMAISFLVDTINSGKLTVSTRHSVCRCIENWASSLTKACGGDSEIDARRKEESAHIRKANLEIHRLEQLIGSNRGFDGIPETMSVMSQTFKDYWELMGFSLVYDSPHRSTIGEGGGFQGCHGHLYYHAACVTSLDSMRGDESAPVTAKKKQQEFVENMAAKLDLFGEGRHDRYVLDTPKNRKYIQKALLARFPSLTVEEWCVRSIGRRENKGTFYIRGINIIIDNCAELMPTEEEKAAREAKRKKWEEGR